MPWRAGWRARKACWSAYRAAPPPGPPPPVVLPLPTRPAWAPPRQHYSLDPSDRLRAEAEAERLGLEILGVYHSHPDHPARPSETDLELALPWYCYVITSVERGRVGASAAWRLADDHRRI